MCAAKRMGADRAQGGDFMISSVLRDCAVVSHNSLLKLEYLSTIATCTCLKRLAELFSCSIANFWELMSRKWEDAFWQWKVVAKMELRLPCILLWRLELEDSVRKRQQEQKTDRPASLSEGVGGNYGVGLDMVMWHMCRDDLYLSLWFFGSPQYIAADVLWYNVHDKVMYVSLWDRSHQSPEGGTLIDLLHQGKQNCSTSYVILYAKKDQDLRMPLS